jgi:ribosomal protein S18 acetylase RimI-like enzyme
MHDALANPVWSSLTTTHAGVAQGSAVLKRFAPDVAPFCAVEQDGVVLPEDTGMQPGEAVYFIGAAPALPRGWTVEQQFQVLQMVYEPGGATLTELAADADQLASSDIPAMLELTNLAYPEFFRPRTAELGRYIGIRAGPGLGAMAGQRMACTGYREISGVITHPAHRGHGHAGRLIEQLTHMILAEGRLPFLHVSATNKSAWTLYENLGFTPVRQLATVKIRIG